MWVSTYKVCSLRWITRTDYEVVHSEYTDINQGALNGLRICWFMPELVNKKSLLYNLN